MKNCLRICMIMICIIMQLSTAMSIRLGQKSSNILLRLSAHGIMTSSPHVATASSHNFNLLLPVTAWGLYYRASVIRGLNDSCGCTGLALLSLPSVRMLLLESTRWSVYVFLMDDDIRVDIGATQNTRWESCRHTGVQSMRSRQSRNSLLSRIQEALSTWYLAWRLLREMWKALVL